MIQSVEGQTGRPVLLRPEPGLAGKAHAAYAASDPDERRHLVLYDPEYADYLNHLLPHELGHVQLFTGAESDDRLLPHIDGETRAQARRVLLAELPASARPLLRSTLDLTEILDLWSSGVIVQASNYPQDILIERMIFNEHPDLRASQRQSLARMAQESHDGLDSRIMMVTPKTVSVASQAMNYALLKSCARFLGEPWMVRPYRRTTFEHVGEELLDIFNAVQPEDLGGSIEVSRRWNEHLGIDSWFRWAPARGTGSQPRAFWET